MATAATSTGYGPRHSRLIFNGNELKSELWELKFLGYLKLLLSLYKDADNYLLYSSCQLIIRELIAN